MTISRRNLIKALAIAVPALKINPTYAFSPPGPEIQNGPFKGTKSSLEAYQIPDWYKDAKFGIWAHWGLQSAIGAGDWYARNMYIQGHKQYDHHLENYGHPSKVGYKDVISTWKADAFDADYLMELYKKAGAKYFMSLAVHHDNIDLWNSQHNKYNTVKMGPKKDIVGLFAAAARKQGLKFGVSDHLWVTPKWFSVAKGADAIGPMAGVPYDGANSIFNDYYGDSKEIFLKRLPWNEDGISEAWKKHWFERIKDLVDQYEPDLLYSDGHIPFGEYGYSILAHLYNKKIKGGKTQAVYTSKNPKDSEVGTCVFDVERGVVDGIWPNSWQTDTCIGDWHYNADRVGRYKSPKVVVDLLVDIVSRNGNLMLNFPLPANGMLDKSELDVLEGISKWMSVNSEGIYATRPWKIFGDGPLSKVTTNPNEVNSAQQFNEKNRKHFTHEDIRFTTKKDNLYAFFMGWPQNAEIVIKPLSTVSEQKTGRVEKVELLGYGKVSFTRDETGLKIKLPTDRPCEHAFTLKIFGKDLV